MHAGCWTWCTTVQPNYWDLKRGACEGVLNTEALPVSEQNGRKRQKRKQEPEQIGETRRKCMSTQHRRRWAVGQEKKLLSSFAEFIGPFMVMSQRQLCTDPRQAAPLSVPYGPLCSLCTDGHAAGIPPFSKTVTVGPQALGWRK